MKVYFAQDDVKYYDFDFYCDYGGCDEPYTLLDNYVYNLVTEGELDKLLDKNYIPALGEEIHVVPGCPIAMEDIRKNYKIRRGVDSGQCNVFSPYRSGSRSTYAYSYAFCPSRKVFIATTRYRGDGNYKHAINLLIQSLLSNGVISPEDKIKYFYNTKRLYEEKIPYAYLGLIKGELTKPCVSYKVLQFEHCNELSLEMLELVYRVCTVDKYSRDALTNAVVQLSALNQTNWRDYPFTISIFLNGLVNQGIYTVVASRKSTQPKNIRALLTQESVDKPASEKDYAMAKSLVDNLLGLNGAQFTTYQTIRDKLNVKQRWALFQVYDNIVKLVPKKYDEN